MKRERLTQPDPDFLEAVSQAFHDLMRRRPEMDESKLASALGIDQSTLSKYIHKKNRITGEVLARACVDVNVGLRLKYKGFEISAAAFRTSSDMVTSAPPQLEFSFDAQYQNETTSWNVSHRKSEPMEFLLRVKLAS